MTHVYGADGIVDTGLHIGNVFHHDNTARKIISDMHDAFQHAKQTIPPRDASILYDVDDIVFMAQLLLNATETSEDDVRQSYPEFVSMLESTRADPFPGMVTKEDGSTTKLVSRAIKTSLKSSGTDITGLKPDDIASAFETDSDSHSSGGEDDGDTGTKPQKKQQKRKAVDVKSSAPVSSLTLPELLADPYYMCDSKHVVTTHNLDYNAPTKHYNSIIAKCQWANVINTSPMVRRWFVIVFMYCSDGLRDRIRAATPKNIAKPYFDGLPGVYDDFDTRIAKYLFGVVLHDRRKKKRIIEKVACPSLLIVIQEMAYFDRLMQLAQVRS